jgi:hypothetical protein
VGPFVVGELVGLSDGFRVGGCEIGTFEPVIFEWISSCKM